MMRILSSTLSIATILMTGSICSADTIHVPSQQPTIQAGISDGFVKSDIRGGINAGPYQRWVARYNGPGNDTDWAYDMALDANGNVYVTGFSYWSDDNRDYATIKYDTDSNELWVARYDGPGNGLDLAAAIALDADGNVYVTGYSEQGIENSDYATIKYDTDGNELWVARYDGPGNSWDSAQDIALDAFGNVYVTGGSCGSGTSSDYATIKYDTDGNELWVARYHQIGNSSDGAIAIVLDADGNVYVAGGSGLDYETSVCVTIKYDTDGNELWVAYYSGPGSYLDYLNAIALDADGSVYVTGGSQRDWEQNDYVTIKYDTDGNELWVARYNCSGFGWDSAHDIALDADGNVYVTGGSDQSPDNRDYATIKYDTDGNELWVAHYNGPGNLNDGALAIALDSDGNVYVTGASRLDDESSDYATIKYDTDGNELWVARYDNTGNSWNSAIAIALDAGGNIYVTGLSYVSGTNFDYVNYDYVTIKYGQSPPHHMIPVQW